MYSRMDQVKFVEDSLQKPYHSNFCKGCLPQILLGPFLNKLFCLTHVLTHSFFSGSSSNNALSDNPELLIKSGGFQHHQILRQQKSPVPIC